MPKTQGISARKTCPDDILVALLNGKIEFEKLAELLAKDYARATVSKYLTELFEDKEKKYVERLGRRGAYYLTEKGRKKARTKQFVKQINEISDDFTEQFILNYKDWVMNKVKNSLFFPYNTARSTTKLGTKDRPMLPPENRIDYITWSRIGLSRLTVRPYSEIEKLATLLETDLTKNGFSDEEILKLWIIGNGILMTKAVKAYGAPNFFAELPFKFPPIIISLWEKENDFERVKKEIKEKLRTFNPDDIQKEMSVFDLFP
jgi:hypothetical protein